VFHVGADRGAAFPADLVDVLGKAAPHKDGNIASLLAGCAADGLGSRVRPPQGVTHVDLVAAQRGAL
jgi:hypothetical protein